MICMGAECDPCKLLPPESRSFPVPLRQKLAAIQRYLEEAKKSLGPEIRRWIPNRNPLQIEDYIEQSAEPADRSCEVILPTLLLQSRYYGVNAQGVSPGVRKMRMHRGQTASRSSESGRRSLLHEYEIPPCSLHLFTPRTYSQRET